MAFVWHTHLMLDQIVVSFSSKKQFLILNLPSNNSSYLIANSQKLVNITSQNINKKCHLFRWKWPKFTGNWIQMASKFQNYSSKNSIRTNYSEQNWDCSTNFGEHINNKIVRGRRWQLQLIAKCSDFSLWSYIHFKFKQIDELNPNSQFILLLIFE